MKRILLILVTAIAVLTLSVTAFASDDTFVGENEFTLVSFNGVNTFVKPGGDITKLEDATFWMLDMKQTYNYKHIAFVGNIANSAPYRFASEGQNDSVLTSKSLADEGWNAQYKNFADAVGEYISEGVPMGISVAINDYIPDGRRRDNLISKHIHAETYVSEENGEYLDEINSYSIVENNGQKYMIFSLELWPRTTTLNWFIESVEQNPDKYVIVYTQSFIDASGKMYTMWDWNTGFKAQGTTTLKAYNLTNIDKARDGEGVWNYAFSKFDNILAVISSYVKVGGIVTGKTANERGVETALIAANADVERNAKGVTALLTKFSADNTEITCAWTTAFKGIDEKSIVTIKLDKLGTLKEATANESLPQIPVQYNGANTAYIFGYEGNTFRPNANMTRAEACTIFARLILGKQTIPDGYKTRFTDVKESDWFYNAIAFLDETGYFFRNTSTTYKPNEPITRAEFVELARFSSSLTGTKTTTFTDVPEDHFYYDSIMASAASGLVNGYEDNTFRPDKTITRAEVVTVINRLLGLKVSDRTVDASKLNEFTDVKTHWGRLNILMASNSNVHGAYYYEASLDGVTDTNGELIFANKHFSFAISKKNGKVNSIVNLADESSVLASTTNPYFIYLTNAKGSSVAPTKLEFDGNRIKVTFKNKLITYIVVDVNDNYMTFEIDSEIPKTVKSITFANLTISPDAVKAGYLLNAVGMSAWTNPVQKGYRDSASSSIAHSYTMYDAGTMGAKLGIVFSKKADAIPFLQEVMDAIDPSVGLVSKAGGAYAREWEGNYGDYAIISDINPETLSQNLDLAVQLGVDQYDIHQGAKTFIQGDFTFAYTESGTAKEYYEKIGSKIADAGLETGLHTYAYYISPSAKNILSNPKWQKDLDTLESYTLRKKLSKTNRNVATVEDATSFNANALFFVKTSRYVLIDEEIIQVGQGTTSGLINCVRGACGTTATTHEKDAKIIHLSGYFSMLVPKLGSDLFYHIADLTAKAYNEGGFDMLYIDAIDGLSRHLPEGHETWYYFQMFVQRITSQCKRPPIVETSAGAPSEWNVRGRSGAWDYANYSIKKHIANHVASNKNSMSYNMTTTLGWFTFFPDENTTLGLKNTLQKTIFKDDIDFLGINSLIYDMSIVYHPLDDKSINENPFHRDNVFYYYNTYTKLRKSHYFTEETLNKVKEIGGEWKVVEKSKGNYVLQRMYYQYGNFGNAKGVEDTLKGQNIFMEQSPFIRIESRYSTLYEKPFTMVEFDETAAVGAANVVKTFSGVNMQNNGMVVTVKIKGTGADGDAMLISLAQGQNGESDGRRDHFIDLNYEGWREFILLDFDNADYDVNKYKFSGITTTGSAYNTYRFTPSPLAMNRLTIRTTGATGKNAMIDDIILQPHSDAPIKNPTVKVGAQSMTFNCEMKGGDFLEFDPKTGKAILYHNTEQTTEEVTYTGMLKLKSGDFTASYTAEALSDAPLRGRLVFGFYGQEIGNN